MSEPRQWVLRGHVPVAALLLEGPERRARVRALWEPGATLRGRDDALLLVFPQARRMDVRLAPGLPFVRTPRGGLAALPDVGAEPAGVLRARAGQLERERLADFAPVDAGAWLELDAWVHRGAPLEEPLARITDATEPEAESTRDALGPTVPTPSEGQTAFLDALAKASERAPESPGWLARTFGGGGVEGGVEGDGAFDRLDRWMRRRVARSELGRVLGRRQADFLERMRRDFERGHLDEALRHAIPLKGPAGERLRIALGVPRARSSLAIGPDAAGGTSMVLGDDYYGGLEALYRKAAAALEAEGRIEEAAFVWVELLGDASAGVRLLERHERYREAARVAEARKLDVGWVIRLWMAAGEMRRALTLARRHAAFESVVGALRRGSPEERALRLLWADHLGQSGRDLAAVRALGNLEGPEVDGLRRRFLERALATGGATRARALALAFTVAPEAAAQWREGALALLASDAEDAARLRAALARGLLMSPHHPDLGPLAARSYRALLLDEGRDGSVLEAKLAKDLLAVCADPLLRDDAPTAGRAAPPRTGTLELVRDASGEGLVSPWDARPVASGRVLVALGERGVRLMSRDGRVVHRFERPAHELVVAESGTRVIGVMKRGHWRCELSLFDLADRRAVPWFDLDLQAFARDFDGARWLVTRGDEIMCLDATRTRPEAHWRAELGHPVDSVSRAGRRGLITAYDQESWELYLVDEARGLERRKALTMREEDPFGALRELRSAPLMTSSGLVHLKAEALEGDRLQLGLAHDAWGTERKATPVLDVGSVTLAAAPHVRVEVDGKFVCLTLPEEGGTRIVLLKQGEPGRVVLRLEVRGARADARLGFGSLVVRDGCGGIECFGVDTGRSLGAFALEP